MTDWRQDPLMVWQDDDGDYIEVERPTEFDYWELTIWRGEEGLAVEIGRDQRVELVQRLATALDLTVEVAPVPEPIKVGDRVREWVRNDLMPHVETHERYRELTTREVVAEAFAVAVEDEGAFDALAAVLGPDFTLAPGYSDPRVDSSPSPGPEHDLDPAPSPSPEVGEGRRNPTSIEEADAAWRAKVLEFHDGYLWLTATQNPRPSNVDRLLLSTLRVPSGWAEGRELVSHWVAFDDGRSIGGVRVMGGQERPPVLDLADGTQIGCRDGRVWVDPLPGYGETGGAS